MRIEIPSSYQPHLRIGTCSWKYASWKGLFYDAEKKYRPDDYLSDYSRCLNSVEVDQWFWSLFPGGVRLPEARTVKNYAASVPSDFKFTVKAPNSLTLTHFYSKQAGGHGDFAGKPNPHFLDNALLREFLERLAPLDNKLGPLMFQFEYLNKAKMASQQDFLERFGGFIGHAPKGVQYAIEIRNPNYLNSAFFECLGKLHLGFVYLEGYYMPPIGEIFDRFQPATSDFCVIRLHGGDRLAIEAETGDIWDKIISPKPEGIRAAVRIARHNIERKILTYVNVNNHFEGSAPLTIERFVKALSRGT